MALFKNKLNAVFFLIAVISGITIILSTCGSPLGFGAQVDWEPPVLTLEPIPTPCYVQNGKIIRGTVIDNVAVDRVVLIDTATNEVLATAVINGNNWEMVLSFPAHLNGRKIVAQVAAYDLMGNCGADSIAIIILVIDISPPRINDMYIKRTDSREVLFKRDTLTALKALEADEPAGDKKGENKNNLFKYQNGWFTLCAEVNDAETRVQDVKLNFYDVDKDMNLPLFDDGGLIRMTDSNAYFPRWLIKEEDIINAGAKKFGAGYKTDYYNGKRYYYRVSISAIDRSGNTTMDVQEDQGYICLWVKSDEPKGLFDVSQGGSTAEGAVVVSRGSPLPVNFFDDDVLDWAYADLLTLEQWNGSKSVGGGISLTGTDDNKLLVLKNALRAGTAIYNWNSDKHSTNTPFTRWINGGTADDVLVYVPTSNNEGDYGEYVLVTLAGDRKLAPHVGNGPEVTNMPSWKGQMWRISVIDENAPLIVFDTKPPTGGPEENTFPELDANESFDIVGYTLRDRGTGTGNKVTTFRMAWIPSGMPGTETEKINAVKDGLAINYPAGINAITGVQHWEFREGGGAGYGTFPGAIDDTDNKLYRQDFRKKFYILGNQPDSIKGAAYKNFWYNNSKFENETKLFIFYARDNMGKETYRQLRLLSNKTPPVIKVYDVTNLAPSSSFTGMPNSNEPQYFESSTGGLNSVYYDALRTYNAGKYTMLHGIYLGYGSDRDKYLASSFQIYPRDTILKYLAEASGAGFIGIEDIKMLDITYAPEGSAPSMGSSNIGNKDLTFCEMYPDVSNRTFLFIAKDKLNNEARVQRTIAITNAARLENITTTSQTGTYGIGKTITLTANFTSQIYINGGGIPSLNVRYTRNGQYYCEHVPCSGPLSNPNDPNSRPNVSTPSLTLEFAFKVPDETDPRGIAAGTLETTFGAMVPLADSGYEYPISLPYGTTINDYTRKDPAFVPGQDTVSVTMPNWMDTTNTLQAKKTITLDGRRPRIGVAAVSGKTAYVSNDYYFKAGESIVFTLTGDKPIRATGTSTLRYQIQDANGTLCPGANDYYLTTFKYQKPGVSNSQLVYNLLVDAPPFSILPYDGELVNVSLSTATGNIEDNSENTAVLTAANLIPAGTHIYIKQRIPDAPVASLPPSTPAGAGFGVTPNITLNYKDSPTLTISTSVAAQHASWEDTRQYSLDGGLTWTDGNTPLISTAGTYTLQVRYKDRAGNEGAIREQKIEVRDTFPALRSVNAQQPNGYYITGSTLTFNLNFEDTVIVNDRVNVKITLKNRSANTSADNEMELSTNLNNGARGTTVTFNWPNISAKEMREGLYISNVNLSGLRDLFEKDGPNNGTATCTGTPPTVGTPSNISINSCPNLTAGVIVDAIAPTVTARTPAHDTAPTSTAPDITQITLTFREPVMKGNGTITIRPRGNYAIPPVLEDAGYYLGTDGSRYSSPGANRTYISSFYDIYNNSALSSTERGYLTQGTSMSDLVLNVRTGQSAGPYKKTTHGLLQGAGYTGNYTATSFTNGNGPSPSGTNFWVPDTATKWVLDYQYLINDTTANSAVSRIRDVLTKAKWRWQEIDAVSTSVSGSAVTIPLNEPLLKGLEWDIYYPAGTFTDVAGNAAPASGGFTNGAPNGTNTDYYFTTPGVQKPVVRVNRRSYDGRTNGWATSQTDNAQAPTVGYANPQATTNWNVNTPPASFAHTGAAGDPGWDITSFNTIHYRVECESPGAAMAVTYHQGAAGGTAGSGVAKGAWTGNVLAANTGVTAIMAAADCAWNRPNEAMAGSLVTSNIIRRSRITGNSLSYTVTTQTGTPETRTFSGYFGLYRSYNRDRTDLSGGTAVTGVNYANGQGVLTFDPLEASKSYVAATATKNGQSLTGYEGVFRTVIVLLYDTARGTSYIAVQGSNVKNGMPSIAGFPVRDAEEAGDARFMKLFYNETTSPLRNFYWVSTEIVSEWYFLSWGGRSSGTPRNGTHQSEGEVNVYITVGYGDLTYGFDVNRSNEP